MCALIQLLWCIAGIFAHPFFQSDDYKTYAQKVCEHVDAVAAEAQAQQQQDPATVIAGLQDELQRIKAELAEARQKPVCLSLLAPPLFFNERR